MPVIQKLMERLGAKPTPVSTEVISPEVQAAIKARAVQQTGGKPIGDYFTHNASVVASASTSQTGPELRA